MLKFPVELGVPEIVIVFAMLFFDTDSPSGSSVVLASVAPPPQVYTIVVIEFPRYIF